MTAIPDRLVQEISGGRCVAFVGAGMVMPVVPGWEALLCDLSEQASAATAQQVRELVAGGSSRHLEAAAQALKDDIGPDFESELKTRLESLDEGPVVEQRLRLLREIPFRAILTTNFDPFLGGVEPGPEAYLTVLRPPHRPWWALERNWQRADHKDDHVVKLHGSVQGDVGTVVFTLRDYRSRLYHEPGYLTFLKSVFATSTVLYLGVSFTDAYLNEVRSEILALLGHQPAAEPMAYAVLPDVTAGQAAHLLHHEAIEVIPYTTDADGGHSGFDDILGAVHAVTDPFHKLGRIVNGRRIVWLDPTSENNVFGVQLLKEGLQSMDGRASVIEVGTVEEALKTIKTGADLVITHWGWRREPGSTAEDLLQSMRSEDLRAPVLVFSQEEQAAERKPIALGLGAADYTYTWESLVGAIERVLG